MIGAPASAAHMAHPSAGSVATASSRPETSVVNGPTLLDDANPDPGSPFGGALQHPPRVGIWVTRMIEAFKTPHHLPLGA